VITTRSRARVGANIYADLPALVAQFLDVFKVLGELPVAGDNSALDDAGELFLFKGTAGVGRQHVVDVRQEQIPEEVGRLSR